MTRWDGHHMLPAAFFRDALRAAWRTRTLGEIRAATGVGVSTIHRIIHSDDQGMVRMDTAVKLRVGLRALGVMR